MGKITVFMLACILPTQTLFAKTLVDVIQKPQCFSAKYNAAHLKAHPKQQVSTLWVYVPPAKMADYGGERMLVSGLDGMGQVIAQFKNDKAYYFSDGTECRVESSGIWHCGIECDGGQFTLQAARAGGILFKPLYERIRMTSCGDVPKEQYIKSADDQRVFALQPIALAACKHLMKEYNK